jgi:D-serine deaminase-like pyridoxal phosphate-dependent protein
MSAGFEADTLAALDEQTIDWRWRGFPVGAQGRSVAAFLASKPGLADFTGPLLVADSSALSHNIETFASWCAQQGASLAPHGKTTMSPRLFAAQIEAGAWGITVATVGQARVCRHFGFQNVVIANQVLDPASLAWVAQELRAHLDVRILWWVDSVAGVQAASAALAQLPAPRPLEVLVEIGVLGRRSGCRTDEEAVLVARAVEESAGLRLAGVAGYAAVAADLEHVDLFLHRMAELTHALDAEDHFSAAEEIIVSAGGSMHFDRVTQILGALTASRPVRTLLRSGCYVTHDEGIYARNTPSSRGVAGAPDLWPALTIWGQVTSQPEESLAIVTMGKRDVAYDEGFPIPRLHGVAGIGEGTPLTGAEVLELNDQHAYVRFDPASRLRPGDWVGFGISHPCSMFDRWSAIPVVADGTVVDVLQTFF